MAKTNYENIDEKKGLQERALKLKPDVFGVVATDRGWAAPQPNGTLELLVSFGKLDELLGDEISEVEQVGEPIEVTPEPIEPEVPEVVEPEPTPEVVEPEEKPEVIEPVVEAPAAKTKPGPKKKAA